jgi:hypothetical protein
MKPWLLSIGLLSVCGVVGCGPNVYTVRFTNNSPQRTDFVIDEPGGYSDDTFVPNVAGNGGKQTVTHQSGRNQTDIASGTLIGQQLVVIDARCSAKVTDGDIVDVVKQPDGSLTCTVTPGANPQDDPRSSNRLLRGLLGR